MGEGNFETLEKYVAATMKFYKDQNALKNHALPLNPAAELLMPNSNLKFPGKIACSKSHPNDAVPELYAISDSGNHRIVIISASGDVLHKIGGKQAGFVDGDLKSAKFNSPQVNDLVIHLLSVKIEMSIVTLGRVVSQRKYLICG